MFLAAAFALTLYSVTILPIAPGVTPEATVRSVVEGITQRNPDTIIAAYENVGLNAKAYLTKLFSEIKTDVPVYSIQSVTVTENGETATAKVKISLKGNYTTPPEESVNLIKLAGDWKISNREGSQRAAQGLYAGLGAFLKNPQAAPTASQNAASTTVLSHMKQLAVACLLLSGDNDDKFPLSTATLKTKLYPYVKSNDVFSDASGKPLPLEFNPNLNRKKQQDVARPAETVMLSLGSKGKLVFTDDRTPIAFVDGHVKYLTRAQISILRWTP